MTRELHFKDEKLGGILIINIGGRVDGVNAQEFHGSLDQTTQGVDGPVILDFKNLTYISSAGLRSILLVAKVFRDKKKSFMLCSLPDLALQVIHTSGFDKIVEIHESRSTAITATMT